jgi:hypothetical protein
MIPCIDKEINMNILNIMSIQTKIVLHEEHDIDFIESM